MNKLTQQRATTVINSINTINLFEKYIEQNDFEETVETILNNNNLTDSIDDQFYTEFDNIEDLVNTLDAIEEMINDNFEGYDLNNLGIVEPIKLLAMIEENGFNGDALTVIIHEHLNNEIEENKNLIKEQFDNVSNEQQFKKDIIKTSNNNKEVLDYLI